VTEQPSGFVYQEAGFFERIGRKGGRGFGEVGGDKFEDVESVVEILIAAPVVKLFAQPDQLGLGGGDVAVGFFEGAEGAPFGLGGGGELGFELGLAVASGGEGGASFGDMVGERGDVGLYGLGGGAGGAGFGQCGGKSVAGLFAPAQGLLQVGALLLGGSGGGTGGGQAAL
jgi:hypothetical protein